MKIQIVILPQWVITQYAENFTSNVITSLVKELNITKPVIGENHVNLKLGVVERAYYQPNVGVIVEANINTDSASTELKHQLNNFFANPQRNIYASFAGVFDTSPKKPAASTIFDVLGTYPNARIKHIQPSEVSLLSSNYNPAIAGSMLRHNAAGDVDNILTADFDLNNGGVKRKNMSTEETKKDTPASTTEGISDKDVDDYIATIEDAAYRQGLVVGHTRSSLEEGIKKHELILEEDEQKLFSDYLKTDKRPTDVMLKLVNELQSTIKHNERKASKKAEASKPDDSKKADTSKAEDSKKAEDKPKDKTVPPRPDPPKSDIGKDKKIPLSYREKIKAEAERLKKGN